MVMTALVTVSAVVGCAGKAVSSDGTFTPEETINQAVTSSPGGGSDIYTRMISDIMTKENLVNGQPIIITNKTNGNSEIGRNEVATTKRSKADYTLLTFSNGDLVPMVQNIRNHSSNFRILTVMTADKQPTFKGEQTKYADFKEAIEAAKDDTKVVIGGSKGDDIATYNAMLEEIGVGKDVMSYTTYDSIGDAITAAPGGHVEFVISRPVAASEYVTAGSLIPVLTLSTERYTGNLTDAPTLGEIGDREGVEVPIWHGVATLAAMSNATTAYWGGQLGKVTETDTRKSDYLGKDELIGNYMDTVATTEYVATYGKDYMATNGIR